ncbi:MAG: copper ion binding protein, partial [Dehalococcoidia bacterium]
MTTETQPTNRPTDVDILTIGVSGMTCASCVSRVERALKKVPGVSSAAVNLATEKATVSFDGEACEIGDLLGAIEAAGYEPRRQSLIFDVTSPLDDAAANALAELLGGVNGVAAADVSAEAARATVTFPSGAVDARALVRTAAAAGYAIKERTGGAVDTLADERRREASLLKRKWIFAGVIGAFLMAAGFWREFGTTDSLLSVQEMLTLQFALALQVMVFGGEQFFVATWKNLKHRTADMNTLIAVGTTAAFVYST